MKIAKLGKMFITNTISCDLSKIGDWDLGKCHESYNVFECEDCALFDACDSSFKFNIIHIMLLNENVTA